MDEVAGVALVAIDVGHVVKLAGQRSVVLGLLLLHLHGVLLLNLCLLLGHELFVVLSIELDEQPPERKGLQCPRTPLVVHLHHLVAQAKREELVVLHLRGPDQLHDLLRQLVFGVFGHELKADLT